jgi:hypothetical protein
VHAARLHCVELAETITAFARRLARIIDARDVMQDRGLSSTIDSLERELPLCLVSRSVRLAQGTGPDVALPQAAEAMLVRDGGALRLSGRLVPR